MQLHIEYSRMNQIFTAIYQQFKCFNHEWLILITHSLFNFIQSVHNVSAHCVAATHDSNLLQNDTIALSMNS